MTTGPVLFAYDGSELAGHAIAQAATQLATPREAVIVCAWQPVDVGFTPVGDQHFDTNQANEVRAAAEAVAAQGVALAEKAGFTARPVTVEASPTWKGIVAAAEQEKAALIVLGAHHHGRLAERLLGHVALDVIGHAHASVLVIHQDPSTEV